MFRVQTIQFLIICAVFCLSGQADAGWHEFWHRTKLDWHRNNAWPQPFVCMDRQAARAPFGIIAEKGWQRQTTIGHFHFHPETHQLTEAGVHKLRWIMMQAPPERRRVFVTRGYTQESTAIRTESVHQVASKIQPDGPLPQILHTDIQYRGWPADEIDAIGRKIQSTLPEPRLPEFQSTTGATN